MIFCLFSSKKIALRFFERGYINNSSSIYRILDHFIRIQLFSHI